MSLSLACFSVRRVAKPAFAKGQCSSAVQEARALPEPRPRDLPFPLELECQQHRTLRAHRSVISPSHFMDEKSEFRTEKPLGSSNTSGRWQSQGPGLGPCLQREARLPGRRVAALGRAGPGTASRPEASGRTCSEFLRRQLRPQGRSVSCVR